MSYITDQERLKYEDSYRKMKLKLQQFADEKRKDVPTKKEMDRLCEKMVEIYVQIHGEEILSKQIKQPKFGAVKLTGRNKAKYIRDPGQEPFHDLYNLKTWYSDIENALRKYLSKRVLLALLEEVWGTEVTEIGRFKIGDMSALVNALNLVKARTFPNLLSDEIARNLIIPREIITLNGFAFHPVKLIKKRPAIWENALKINIKKKYGIMGTKQ